MLFTMIRCDIPPFFKVLPDLELHPTGGSKARSYTDCDRFLESMGKELGKVFVRKTCASFGRCLTPSRATISGLWPNPLSQSADTGKSVAFYHACMGKRADLTSSCIQARTAAASGVLRCVAGTVSKIDLQRVLADFRSSPLPDSQLSFSQKHAQVTAENLVVRDAAGSD